MKKGNKLKKAAFVSLVIICIAVLVVSLYQGLVIYIPQKQEQHRFTELRQLVDSGEEYDGSKYDEIAKMNSDFKGWLKIEDTKIDYPVVKPSEEEPEYYLHRDFDKNYSFSGTPFIGAGADENSDSFIIYAHNMKTDTMFGKLDDYADSQWATAHKDIVFETQSERRVYRVFAVFQTKVGAADEFKYYEKVGELSDGEYNALVDEIKGVSKTDIGESPDEKAQILMLSTCSYHTQNGRFVVAAYRIN